jgi:predicted PurR-regulated permease PerM
MSPARLSASAQSLLPSPDTTSESSPQPQASASPTRIGARAAVGVVGVVVATLALWRLRTLVILLLLAVTLAAALRPGVQTLRRRRIPEPLAILLLFLPSGSAVIHPIATYGKKGTEAVVGVLFTLAATWYFISERDDVINALVMLSPEHKRERARETSRMTASAAPRRGRSRRRSPSRT